MNLSEPFIRRPVMTAVLTASVIVFGVICYRQLPVNDLPAVDYPVIQVVVVIFVFLGRATDTLIPAVALPLSLLLTFVAMRQACLHARTRTEGSRTWP